MYAQLNVGACVVYRAFCSSGHKHLYMNDNKLLNNIDDSADDVDIGMIYS